MKSWTIEDLKSHVHNFEKLNEHQRSILLEKMNSKHPPHSFEKDLQKRRNALKNSKVAKNILQNAHSQFPGFIKGEQLQCSPESLKGYGLVFTAGGEGERLRLSLLKKGVDPQSLNDFTKATYPLHDFFDQYGSLHINLKVVAHFCSKLNISIPVIITTGPEGSLTERVIKQVLKKHHNFGLKDVLIVPQDERLHFTSDEKIAFTLINDLPEPVTQPDETGGPLMKLKQKSGTMDLSALQWLNQKNCSKLIVVQATAIYDLNLLPMMAKAAKEHDCLGVGILRTEFPSNDPFGTYVTLKTETEKKTCIIEQDIRNEKMRSLKDESGQYYLPFNTGFYALNCSLLENNELPDYATPPKEVLPELDKSPKIGYAATDILPLAEKPVVLTVDPNMFAVIKTADDLIELSKAAKRYRLDTIVKE
ncbi:hypothetical protein QA601_15830 [Chitinispirillales bacterium ANBcel5]|uniref:hypothetical protein n=1 Tax=Cellulosispirillum alkaliphilum TaxID=3039283 RepID=UPI002A581470|nr:hypothetical protein [Chitinispirillales bacterium ANBcel5]